MVNWKRLFRKGRDLPPDRTTEIFRRHFSSDFTVFPMADRQAKTADIEAVEDQIGFSLPPAFVTHILGRFPGVHVEVRESIRRRPQALEVGPFWSFLYGFHTFTPVPESEEWMRLDRASANFAARVESAAVPVLRVVGDADVYCARPDGSIARYRHETDELEPVDGDFWHVLEVEAASLAERKEKMVARAGS